MDEEDKRMDDLVDTDERSQEDETGTQERSVRKPASMSVQNQPAVAEEEVLVPLFENVDAEKFRSQWLDIQSAFVDDPRASVRKADALVEEVIKSITQSFAQKRSDLENQWQGGADDASTEDLRLVVKSYRSFFNRLLTLEFDKKSS